MDVMARLDAMEAAHVQDQREIKMLTSEVESLRKENACLREEVSGLRQENAALREEGAALRKENSLLRDDNERMKRILDNDSSNSSRLPGTSPGRLRTPTMGGSPQKRDLAPSRAIKGTACPGRRSCGRSRPGSMGTVLRRSALQTGPISPDTVSTWM